MKTDLMKPDSIVAEVRRVRDRLSARFNYDLDATFAHLKASEKASGRKYVQRAPKLLQRVATKATGSARHRAAMQTQLCNFKASGEFPLARQIYQT